MQQPPHHTANPAQQLAALVGSADLLMHADEKERAADLLAFVMQHPEVSPATYDRAEDLWLALEAELCPRVMWDAKAKAGEMSLVEVVKTVLAWD